jgi:signal transduction histidine kinase
MRHFSVTGMRRSVRNNRSPGPSLLLRAGSALILLGVVVLFPTSRFMLHRHIGSFDDLWERRTLELAEIPVVDVVGRLNDIAGEIPREVSTSEAACATTDLPAHDGQFFYFDADGIQRCGPTLSIERLTAGQWVANDSFVVHAVETANGSLVGIALDADSLLPYGWEGSDFGLRLVSDGAVLASSSPGDPSVGQQYEPFRRRIFTRLSDNPIYMEVSLPPEHDDDQGWFAIGLGYLAVLAVLCGLSIRTAVPLRQWWREVIAPDDAQLLLIDSRGTTRAASRHRIPSEIGKSFRERFKADDRIRIDELLASSRAGGIGLTAVSSTTLGPSVRVVVLRWLFFLRRHVVLVTRYVADPIVEAVANEVNRASCTIVDTDGTLLFIGSKDLTLFGTDGPKVGQNLYDVFGADQHRTLESAHAASLNSPYIIVSVQVRHLASYYRGLIVSDGQGKSYLWLDDVTEVMHSRVLKAFTSQLCSYLRHTEVSRPDLAQYRLQLGVETVRVHGGDHGSGDSRQDAVKGLVDEMHTLLRFADRDRLVASSGMELRLSAARRREFARRLHEQVVQDLVALRWRVGDDPEAESLCDKVLHSTRSIMSELRVPPWEQRTRELLESLAKSIRSDGVSVSLRIETPDPVPFEIISVVGVIAKEALTNALKHARPDEISIDLRTVGSRKLFLTVTDDGTGSGQSGKGAGYGAQMCRELAYEYGGSYVFTNEKKGHIARLDLPLPYRQDESSGIVPLGSDGHTGNRGKRKDRVANHPVFP